jgi:S-adenosyl methyltransferase
VLDEEPPHALIDTSKAHPARVYDYWLGRKVEVF